jgi:hypothetical protein
MVGVLLERDIKKRTAISESPVEETQTVKVPGGNTSNRLVLGATKGHPKTRSRDGLVR